MRARRTTPASDRPVGGDGLRAAESDTAAEVVLALQGQIGNRAVGRLVSGHPADTLVQRWSLEGPWNIGEPVHESLTARSLKAAGLLGMGDAYAGKEAWEYVRGALWNDDPEGLLFDDRDWTRFWAKSTTKYSSGVLFGSTFKSGEREAKRGSRFGPREASLLKRSHFGDLQFLHGMAEQGESAAHTRDKMMMWAEFTYKIGTGVIPGTSKLGTVPVPGIPELFPTMRNAVTVSELFCIRAGFSGLADVEKRALGSLLHMVQDTYAASHTERRYKDGTVGDITGFGKYTEQKSAEHAKKDVPSGYSQAEWRAREKAAVGAGARILMLVTAREPWEVAERELQRILRMDQPAQPSGPDRSSLPEGHAFA